MSSVEFDNQDMSPLSRGSFGDKRESPLVKFLIKNNLIKSAKTGIALLILVSLACIILAFYLFSKTEVKKAQQFKKPIPLIIEEEGKW
ncbi:MAG: hypothetical protein WCG97_01550 [bacterium]